MEAGNYQEAWEICNANKNYLANVLKAALTRIGRGKEAVEDAIAEHGLREATVLRTRNSYLSVIGVVAPMIGLLGTVIGMMGAFAVLGSTGISDPQALAGRIGEVLFATASGLFIAIPAFISYYIFRNMSQKCDRPCGRHGEHARSGHSLRRTRWRADRRELQRRCDAPLHRRRRGKSPWHSPPDCPVCNGAVTPGVNPCPHCGATLDWAA